MEKRSAAKRQKATEVDIVEFVSEQGMDAARDYVDDNNPQIAVGPRGRSQVITTSASGFTQLNFYNADASEAEIVLTWVDHNGQPWKDVVTINRKDHSVWKCGVYKGAKMSITNQSQHATILVTISADF